jgi:hypothetical protein
MSQIADLVINQGWKPCPCPTSEFLNRFLLSQKTILEIQGWRMVFPSEVVYAALSNKSSSPTYAKRLMGITPPPTQKFGQWQAPCVLKPKQNIMLGDVLYPQLCATQEELTTVCKQIRHDDWFSQSWVDGQSFYFCAYLDVQGGWNGFWQENLLQQPNGKSMVLARTCLNPGIDPSHLMLGLHRMGYRGPFMMEVIRDVHNKLYFIEINPRFWGPLELARQACPKILERFTADIDGSSMESGHTEDSREHMHMYSWAYGAQSRPMKIYPAAHPFSPQQLQDFINTNDVYAQTDTSALTLKH